MGAIDEVETGMVECPHCDEEYETYMVGDLETCDFCGEDFYRFQNLVIK